MRKYFLTHSIKSALPQYYIRQDIIGKEVYGLMSVMNMDVQILKKKKKRNEQIRFNNTQFTQLCYNIHQGFILGPTADTKIYGSSSPLYKIL